MVVFFSICSNSRSVRGSLGKFREVDDDVQYERTVSDHTDES